MSIFACYMHLHLKPHGERNMQRSTSQKALLKHYYHPHECIIQQKGKNWDVGWNGIELHSCETRLLTPPKPNGMQNVQKHEEPLRRGQWCQCHHIWEKTNMRRKSPLSNSQSLEMSQGKKNLPHGSFCHVLMEEWITTMFPKWEWWLNNRGSCML
jgi:hypothetical protein